MAEALQLLLSLGAVAALVALVRWLRLGAPMAFPDEDAVWQAASAAVHGFEPVEAALDQNGETALVLDREGRALILKAHGVHVAARLLTGRARVFCDGDALLIDPDDRRFGTVRLVVPDPAYWMNRVRAV